MAVNRYVASDILQALVQALAPNTQYGTREAFWVVEATPGSDQWPISVQVTITKTGWQTPRTFEVPFTVDDFAAKDNGTFPAAEVAAGLATHALILIEEWLAIGPIPGPGIKEVTP